MDEDYQLQQQAIDFMTHLGIEPQNNYFTCYHYPLPILGAFSYNPVMTAWVSKIYLVIFTPTEIIIKKVDGRFSTVSINKDNYNEHLIRLSKEQIKHFEVKEWTTLGIYNGYLLTIEADKKYYFHVAKTTGDDFSTVNFFNVKQNNFYDLVTDNQTK